MKADSTEKTVKPAESAWKQIGDFLTKPHSSVADSDAILRARIAASLTLIFTVFNIIGLLAATPEYRLSLGILTILALAAYFTCRTRFFLIGYFVFSLSISAAGFASILVSQPEAITRTVFAFIPLALILASALLNGWTIFLLTGLNVGAIFLSPYISRIQVQSTELSIMSGIITAIGFVLITIVAFRSSLERARLMEIEATNKDLRSIQASLEERVQERTKELDRRTLQLEAASSVSRQTAAIQDPQSLLSEVVGQISEQFGFYHAGVFLIDESGRYAVLQAASSEGGKRMIKRGHKLEVSRQGIVGYAAYQKRARVALDVGEDASYFDNPDLPGTRSEMALPLSVRGRVIGVLDIQSTEPNAFNADDINTLQAMADQVALAIENARLLSESQTSLKQLQALTAESTYRNWKERLSNQAKGYTYTPLGVMDIKTRSDAIENEQVETLDVPISLRGREIGKVRLSRRGEGVHWTENENLFANEVATQIALALDNARLLEDFRLRAIREQTVGDISTRLSQTTDIDTLLKLAVQELHQLPGTIETSIFVGNSEANQ